MLDGYFYNLGFYLKIIYIYIMIRKEYTKSTIKKILKKGSKEGTKKKSKKGSKKGTKKGSKEGTKKTSKEGSKKETKKGSKEGTKKAKVLLKNTRNEECSKNKMTVCCPHMEPDDKGRYRATNEKSVLKYKGNNYILHTCCLMCSKEMNKTAKSTEKFDKLYKPKKKEDNLVLANKKTGRDVQILKRILG
jgi:hypothetical protein